MPKPSELPTFATTLANRLKPVAGALASGFLAGQRPPPRWVNWLLGTTGDWLTWFDESTERLRPAFTSITATGSTPWVRPTGLVFIEGVLIGGGQAGANGGASVGGKGGNCADIVHFKFPAALLTADPVIVVGAGGASAGASGASSLITVGGATLVWAEGGGPVDLGSWPSDVVGHAQLAAWQDIRGGGDGGAIAAGLRGMHSGFGPGGAGGATNARGHNGFGYGGGGGGGRQASGSNSGGGGGAGGYGLTQPDGNGGGGANSNGFNGNRGACFICAWRDVNA